MKMEVMTRDFEFYFVLYHICYHMPRAEGRKVFFSLRVSLNMDRPHEEHFCVVFAPPHMLPEWN